MTTSSAKKILLVVAHPDDEVLGCGATVARHVRRGDEVHLLVLADGETSRAQADLDHRSSALAKSCQTLGIKAHRQESFPDNQLDRVPLIDVVRKVEAQVRALRPDLVYTHFAHDLNVDHRVAHAAVLTACRPQPGATVREIRCFEVVSSTHWIGAQASATFNPNLFVDVSETLAIKLEALRHYDAEMRPWPHQRSYKGLEVLAQFRGASVGVEAAEAFVVERRIE